MRDDFDPRRSLWDLIAAEVRRQRERDGLSVSQLARRVNVDRSTVSRIEHGIRKLSPEQAEILDALWKTNGLFAHLVGFAAAKDDGDWFTGLVDLEESATLHRMWEALVVPGLFQTERYARALIAAGKDEPELSLERRLSRQAILDRDRPPRISVILNWVTLEQPVGPREVMKEQLGHLLRLSERPNVTIRVMERSAGPHMGLDGSFRLLTVADREVAFSDSPERGRLVLEPSDVQQYTVRYDQIANLAAPVGASRRLIEEAMEAL
ncbi:MAG: helix-turn-helix transcriptional regulator [Actinomadura rubrobrunea]|nr:helix-turn-helix transcriptional regulator [Actinomadura rubrobrunea]